MGTQLQKPVRHGLDEAGHTTAVNGGERFLAQVLTRLRKHGGLAEPDKDLQKVTLSLGE